MEPQNSLSCKLKNKTKGGVMIIPNQSYFFVLVSLVLHTLVSPTLQYCQNDQRDALLEFKHEFPVNETMPNPDEDKLTPDEVSLISWNKSSDCCFWKGVTCDAKSGKVISLHLGSIPLNDSFKPNSGLFKLQYLRNLTLSDCGLYGKIPSSLGNLSRLTVLDLFHNNLVGEIPASIGNLTQLRCLGLALNNLSGTIPVSLANLTKLSILDIAYDQFTGENIPLILTNLTSLSFLDMTSNQIQSTLPLDMSGFHNLETFIVSGNSFVGSFPRSLFMIPSLTLVVLKGNQFKGPIEFGNMSFLSSRLRNLDLSHNNFTGPIPKSISKFVNLKTLDLSHNNFIGLIPKLISKLVNLKTLDLSHNNLIGLIPTSISKFVKLESLDLSNNKLNLSHNSLYSFERSLEVFNIQKLVLSSNSFRGPLPYWICKLRSTMFLDLSNNSFRGPIPQCLKNSFLVLRELSMHNNNLSGTIPDIFVNATSLVSIDISSNQLKGKLPKSLINCTNLEFLNVERNIIKDNFPSWLGTLPSLNVLILRSNQFYGPLFSSIGFQSLKVIDISHNDFTGTLPPFYFSNWLEMTTTPNKDDDYHRYMNDPMYFGYYQISMEMVHKGVDTVFEQISRDFKAIDFSGNIFHGNIPKSIGLLKGLRLLNLSGNAFTSSIPQSLANLTNLEALDLSQNQLSGHIPRDLGSLSFLSTMDFSHNNLEGPIPRGTQFQRQNCSSFMDNPKLNGLEDICGKTQVPNPTPQETEDLSSEPKEQVISWIAAAIAYGPGVFFGLVIGHIFASHKHEWLMEKFGRNKPRRATRSIR